MCGDCAVHVKDDRDRIIVYHQGEHKKPGCWSDVRVEQVDDAIGKYVYKSLFYRYFKR